MGQVKRYFADVFHALHRTLQSVDVRVAAYHVRSEKDEAWRLVCGVVRLSSRSIAAVEARHLALASRLGPNTSKRFTVKMVARPVAWIPILEDGRIILPMFDGAQPILTLYPGRGPLATVERYRRFLKPWDHQPVPVVEYQVPRPAAPQVSAEAVAEIDAEVLTRCGANLSSITQAYLELNLDAARESGTSYVTIEMPASIHHVEVHGTTVELTVTAPRGLAGLRAFAARSTDGRDCLERYAVPLELSSAGGEGSWRGRAGFGALTDSEVLECILTDHEIGELDDFRGRVKHFRPVAEQNPLLTCLRRFWDVEAQVYASVLRPAEIVAERVRRNPSLGFQAGVACMLTLAGFETIDLADQDRMHARATRVVEATADLLAYHRPSHILIVGACTINVSLQEDYDKLLNASALLRREFPERSRVRLAPVLFSGQKGESTARATVEPHGIRVFTNEDLIRFRSLIETGHEEDVAAEITRGIPDL